MSSIEPQSWVQIRASKLKKKPASSAEELMGQARWDKLRWDKLSSIEQGTCCERLAKS